MLNYHSGLTMKTLDLHEIAFLAYLIDVAYFPLLKHAEWKRLY